MPRPDRPLVLIDWTERVEEWAASDVNRLVTPPRPEECLSDEKKRLLDAYRPDPEEQEQVKPEKRKVQPRFRCVADPLLDHPVLRPPVVEGLLREGEIMNVIASPKTGKSWLATDIAIAVRRGGRGWTRFRRDGARPCCWATNFTAQSRAADAHLILRPHAQDGVVVLDAAVRSWPPMEPRCLQWAFPVFEPADHLDPRDLKRPTSRRARSEDSNRPGPTVWTPERFVEAVGFADGKGKADVQMRATVLGISGRQAGDLLRQAERSGLIERRSTGANRSVALFLPPSKEGI